MNDRPIDDDDMPTEVDFSNAVRGLHHIPVGAKVYLPVSIERSAALISAQCGKRGSRNPYTQVPAIALKIATTITLTPFPTSANSGPGHAPASAQPNPNSVPPTT